MQQVLGAWLLAVLWLVQSALVLATTHLDVGMRLFTEQQYAASQEFFVAALRQNGDDAEVHYYLGRIAFALGDYMPRYYTAKRPLILRRRILSTISGWAAVTVPKPPMPM